MSLDVIQYVLTEEVIMTNYYHYSFISGTLLPTYVKGTSVWTTTFFESSVCRKTTD